MASKKSAKHHKALKGGKKLNSQKTLKPVPSPIVITKPVDASTP